MRGGWTTRLRGGKTDDATKTKSERASAEDSGSSNVHRNRLPGTKWQIMRIPMFPSLGERFLQGHFHESVEME
jgi:hypothetical protein